MNAIQRTETIKGSELPARLAEKWGIRPDESVKITVRDPQRDSAELIKLMDAMGAYAESQGLTEAKLQELLADES